MRERQREIVAALRAGGKTQAEAAAILGVARKTVDNWESEGSNGSDANASPPDNRLKLSPQDDEAIYERVAAGETHDLVAADHKVSRRRVVSQFD